MYALDTPILFLVFNRPDTASQVFEKIRQVRPSRLYVAGDGPREGYNEEEKVAKAREIATRVDWPCEVKILFRDKNIGVKLIKKLVKIGYKKDCYRITLTCDQSLINFYSKNGFNVNNIAMKKHL